jgi:hypothetical protein
MSSLVLSSCPVGPRRLEPCRTLKSLDLSRILRVTMAKQRNGSIFANVAKTPTPNPIEQLAYIIKYFESLNLISAEQAVATRESLCQEFELTLRRKTGSRKEDVSLPGWSSHSPVTELSDFSEKQSGAHSYPKFGPTLFSGTSSYQTEPQAPVEDIIIPQDFKMKLPAQQDISFRKKSGSTFTNVFPRQHASNIHIPMSSFVE